MIFASSHLHILTSALIFLLCSCSINYKEEIIGKRGGTLRQNHRGQDPKTFNPWIASDATSAGYAGIMFEGLISSDPETDEPIPRLAKSWQIKDAGKKIIVKLQEDLKWSDGHDLTADDVVYTWNNLIKDEIAVSSIKDIVQVDGKFPSVRKLDKKTIEFKTAKVFAPFLKNLSTEIAPKHDIEKYFADNQAKSFEDKQKLFNNYLNVNYPPEKIVSSGAYKLRSIKHGERIELERNPLFYQKDEDLKALPLIDKVVYSYSQDASSDIFRFLATDSYTLNVNAQNAAFVKSLESKYGFTLYNNGPSSGTNFLWFNLSKNVEAPKYKWFNNKNFRKAISHAIDRENIVNNVFQGLGAKLFTAESLKSPFLNTAIKGHTKDLNYALELLKTEGFELNDSKELFDSEGNRVEFNLFTNAGNQEREFIGVIIASNLAEIGIKVNFKLLEFNNFVSRIMQGKNYDAGVISLTGGNEPNGGANVWKSDGRLHMFDIKKHQVGAITRDWEKEIDSIFSKGVQTMDIEKRKAIYNRFQEIVYEENPMIYLVSPVVLTAASHKIANAKATKYGGIMPFMERTYLNP